MAICGIYKITNLVNGKSYIGQSVNIIERWKEHLRNCDNSNEVGYNTHFYRALRKYNAVDFTFQILEECEPQELDEREKYYIEYYQTYTETGYNLTEGGQDFSCTTARAIKQYTLNGELIATYKSIADAKRAIGESAHIDRVLKGESRSTKGYYWCYADEEFHLREEKVHTSRVCQYTLDGQYITTFNSIKDAQAATGQTGVSYACRKKKRCGKWLWAYEGETVAPYEYRKRGL